MDDNLGPEQRPSLKAIHRAVQNVMFNELGITKPFIEGALREQINGVVATRFDESKITSWMLSVISRVVWGKYNPDALQKLIEKEVHRQVQVNVKAVVDAYLKDTLTVTIGKSDATVL